MRRCLACGGKFEAARLLCPHCDYRPSVTNGFPTFAPELSEEGSGFRPEYYEALAAIEADSFWFCARNELIAWACRRFFPCVSQFLEIGCGTGYVLSRIADVYPSAQLTGSEVFVAGLAFAQDRVPRAEFMQMDARDIPYVDQFDAIGTFDVLEHVEEDEQVLHEIHRALKPGGGLIITVPQHQWLWSRQDEMACHVRRYAAANFQMKLASTGFRTIFRTSFVSLLLPVMWLSRRVRDLYGDEDAVSELRAGWLANAALGLVMGAERWMIQRGLRFPIGGSLLVVALKD